MLLLNRTVKLIQRGPLVIIIVMGIQNIKENWERAYFNYNGKAN